MFNVCRDTVILEPTAAWFETMSWSEIVDRLGLTPWGEPGLSKHKVEIPLNVAHEPCDTF